VADNWLIASSAAAVASSVIKAALSTGAASTGFLASFPQLAKVIAATAMAIMKNFFILSLFFNC
jgi:hypothetical protein